MSLENKAKTIRELVLEGRLNEEHRDEKWVRLEDVRRGCEEYQARERELKARLERIREIIKLIPYPATAYGDELAEWFEKLKREVLCS